MANPQLSVEISATINGLQQGLQQAATSVKNFEKSSSTSLDGLDRNFAILSKSASTASNSVSQSLAKSAAATASSGKAISAGSNQAAFALTNLGRVAQDAPFGFIGIQNNLNPLLESFQRLRAESGSNSAALKALGSSLIGPAGLGIALSVVSSAILLYQQYQQKSNKAAEEAAKRTVDAKTALENYIKTLDVATQAQLKGITNAQKEVIELRHLYEASQNLRIPLSERIKAAKALQEQYPQTFKNFTAEQIALGKASTAYKALAVDIIAVAKAAARTDIIAENEKEIVQLGEKNKQLERQKKTQDDIAKANLQKIKEDPSLGQGAVAYARQAAQAEEKSASLNAEIVGSKNKQAVLRRTSLGLEKEITDEIVKQQKVISVTGIDTSKDPKGRKQYQAKFKKNILGSLAGLNTGNTGEFNDIFTSLLSDSGLLVNMVGVKVPEAIGKTNYALNQLRGNFNYTDEDLTNFVSNYGLGLDDLLAKTVEFNDKISSALNNGIISAFSGIGEAIGSSLASGTDVLEALGTTLLSVFGDLLVNLGKIAIETGVGILAIKTALKSLNPAVAIGAGVALIALGSLIKGKVSTLGGGSKKQNSKNTNIPGFANGVTNFSGGMAIVGERGPELVRLPTGSDVIPNNRSMAMLNGGGQSINLTGGIGISGRELVLFIDDARAAMNRNR